MPEGTTYGIAVIGAGHWGPHLIRNFHEHPQAAVRWIVEANRDRWPALATRFPTLEITDSPDKAFEDPGVDAVVIATPTTTHFELATKALASGKHTMVEKPLSDTSESSEMLVRQAADGGLVLLVGHVFLFNAAVRTVKTMIQSGDLGAIHYISMNRTNLGPVRVDVNAAWDLTAHDLSIANYWLDGEPDYVSATGGSWLNPGIHDAVFATLRYPHNIFVHVEASWLNPRKNRLISVVGETKMATVDDLDQMEPVRIYDKGVLEVERVTDTLEGFRSQIREGAVTIPRIAGGEPLKTECDSFIARIGGSGETLSDGRQGAAVVRALEAVDLSLKQGGAEVPVGRAT